MDKKTHRIKMLQGYLVPAGLLVAVITAYLFTIAPSVSVRDSGDMVSASYTLGVCHPSGFPLYMLLGKAFSFIPIGEIGARYSLLSLIPGALAALFVFLSVRALTGGIVASLMASGFLAFSGSFWAYSSVSEKYTLYAFFSALLVYLATVKGRKPLFLFAFLLGLGLTHHLALVVFVLPALYLAIFRARPEGFKGRDYALAFLFAFLPFLLYLYLPVSSRSGGPLIWTGPMGLESFIGHISAREYRYAMFSGPLIELPLRFYTQVISTFASEFTPVGLFLAACGSVLAFGRDRRAAVVMLLGFASNVIIFVNYNILDPLNIVTYYFASFVILAVWAGLGIEAMLRRSGSERKWIAPALSAALAVVIFVWLFLGNFPRVDRSSDRQHADFGENLLSSIENGSMLFTNGDVPQFSLWYQMYVNGRDKKIDIIPTLRVDQERTIDNNIGSQKIYFSYFPYTSLSFRKYLVVPEGLVYRVYKRDDKVVEVDIGKNERLWKRYKTGRINSNDPGMDQIIGRHYAQARYELGELYMEHGKYSAASEQFEECLKIYPDYVLAHLCLGELAEKAGKKELALKYYGKMLTYTGAIIPPGGLGEYKARIIEILDETVRVNTFRREYDLAKYYHVKRERLAKWR